MLTQGPFLKTKSSRLADRTHLKAFMMCYCAEYISMFSNKFKMNLITKITF